MDFFNETWKNKPKPFKYNPRLMKKQHLKQEIAEANRNTTTQLTEYVTEDGIIRYNKRKLKELPGFIAKLTSNLCIPLACKHIYFNYQFSHGLFHVCSYNDILDDLKNVSKSSSYTNTDEAKNGLMELKFLNYFFMQCLISLSDYPDTMALQILQRTLIFYGFLPHLSELIKQCDNYSHRHCALVAAYQSLPPPGLSELFNLEKHTKPIYCTVIGEKSFIYTLSTKIHIFNIQSGKDSGFIELPKSNEHYKQLLVYFSTSNVASTLHSKLINGVAIVISDKLLYSINLDSSVNFTKEFNDRIIKKIFQITQNHILVVFENSNFFEIYNFYTGEMVMKKCFDKIIKFIETDTQTDRIYESKHFYSTSRKYITVVLQNSELHFFKTKLNEGDKHFNEIKLDLVTQTKPTGIECVECDNMLTKDDYNKDKNIGQFCLSFKDGSLLVAIIETGQVVILKPKFNKVNTQNIHMKLVDYNEDLLYLLLGKI